MMKRTLIHVFIGFVILAITPPSNTKPALPTYLFGCAPPSSIIDKLLSLSHEEKQGLNPTYKDCVFDENGWTFTGDHWFSTRLPTIDQPPRHMKPVMTKRELPHQMRHLIGIGRELSI
jgi:hypothetical protein